MLREESNIIDMVTGKPLPAVSAEEGIPLKKVSYIRHKLARLGPAWLGEPDFMTSEEPKWIKRLRQSVAKKEKIPVAPSLKKSISGAATHHLPEGNDETLWEKIGRVTGIH